MSSGIIRGKAAEGDVPIRGKVAGNTTTKVIYYYRLTMEETYLRDKRTRSTEICVRSVK